MATEALSRAQIDELARKLFSYLTEDDERAHLNLHPEDPAEREAIEKHLARDAAGRLELLRLNDLETARELVEQLLEKEQVPVPIGPNEYWRLCQLALRAYAEAGRQREAKFAGNFGLPIQDKLFQMSAPSVATAPPSGPAQDQVPNISLDEAIRLHVADMSRRGWREGTVRQVNATFRLFKDHMGKTAIAKVERRNVASFDNKLGELPSDNGQNRAYRGKALDEVLAIADKMSPAPDRIKQKTRNRHLSAISGLFTWSIKQGLYEGGNPAEGFIDKKKADETSNSRRPWRPDEIKALLNAPIWRGRSVERRGRFFVPLLSLYGGLRLEEACKLMTDEIYQIDGIWVMDIKFSSEGPLKHKSSVRKVPIHPHLVEFGFLNHVEKMRVEGQTVLWPELRKGGDNRRSVYFTKWFGRYREKLGLRPAPGEPELVFHSLRHNLGHALTSIGTPTIIVENIMGHAQQSISVVVYGTSVDIGILNEAICKIDYRVDLSHLRAQ